MEATRTGSWTRSLRAHLEKCGLCSQTELIASSLRQAAATAAGAAALPPAGVVWRRAQAQRRERQLQRATRRPFIVVGAFGAAYSVVFLVWSFLQLPRSVERLFVLSSGFTGDLALTGGALSAILAIVGSCALILETRR